jgi:hypothetical protein
VSTDGRHLWNRARCADAYFRKKRGWPNNPVPTAGGDMRLTFAHGLVAGVVLALSMVLLRTCSEDTAPHSVVRPAVSMVDRSPVRHTDTVRVSVTDRRAVTAASRTIDSLHRVLASYGSRRTMTTDTVVRTILGHDTIRVECDETSGIVAVDIRPDATPIVTQTTNVVTPFVSMAARYVPQEGTWTPMASGGVMLNVSRSTSIFGEAMVDTRLRPEARVGIFVMFH